MLYIKNLIKAIIPTALAQMAHKRGKTLTINGMWSGNYTSWQEAANLCRGYDSPSILEKCRQSLLKVKTGAAVYERDSVIFDKKQYSWPLLAALQQIALTHGQLHVIDFGGSLGSTYFQNKGFLSIIKNLEWRVVEQDAFVKCGKKDFEDSTLKFYSTIERCIDNWTPNVVVLSSVLQYLEDPMAVLKKIKSISVPYIIIDRTGFLQTENKIPRISIQRVPKEIYEATYPCWFFNEGAFLSEFSDDYHLIADFDSYADPNQTSDDGLKMYWKGFYLKKKN